VPIAVPMQKRFTKFEWDMKIVSSKPLLFFARKQAISHSDNEVCKTVVLDNIKCRMK
jgi:hypothetical protein